MQVLFATEIMPKKGRKKLKIAGSDFDPKIAKVPPVVKVEIVYEDTKAVTGA